MTRTALTGLFAAAVAVGTIARAQNRRRRARRARQPPRWAASTTCATGYVGGKWLEVRYGRPIKRGRDLFGPADYAELLNDGRPCGAPAPMCRPD